MDYSKIDWSRCKLPESPGEFRRVCLGTGNNVLVYLRKTLVAQLADGAWTFGDVHGLSREEVEWALKAADAVDAFLREEERRVELESQPWMTPNELLIYLAKNKGPIRVQSSNYGNREIEFELSSTCLAHSFPDSPSDMMTQTSLGWFLTNNVNYRIIPQSQPDASRVDPGDGWRLLKRGEDILSGDECYVNQGWEPAKIAGSIVYNGIFRRRVARADTPRTEKKWTKSLVVTGEHKLVAVRSAVSPATLEISNTIQNPVTTDHSALPVPGQRVRLTLEVEE